MSVFKRPVSPAPGQPQYWYIRYRLNGKDIRESTGFKVGEVTKAFVTEYLLEKKKDIKLKGSANFSINPQSFEQAASDYIKYARYTLQKKSWQRDYYSLKRLSEAFAGFVLIDIKQRDVISYQTHRLASEVSNATINKELSCLRLLFNHAIRTGTYRSINPVIGIKFLPERNDTMYILSEAEEHKLLSYCNTQLYPIVFTALNTGMRKSEILNLQWKDIDFKNRYIYLKDTKSRPRKVPVNNKLMSFFRNHKSGSRYVFVNQYGKQYKGQDSIKRIFINAYTKAGIGHMRFHDLRHTVATRMIERGANPVAVKDILGHYDFKVTQKYIHPEATLKEAVNLL
jgi:integrase